MLLLSSLRPQQNGVIAQFGNVGMLAAVRPTLAPITSRSPLLTHPHLFQLPSHNERPCDVRGKSSTSLAQPLPSLPPLYAGFFSGHSTPWKMGDPVAHPTLPSQGAANRGGKAFQELFRESDHLIHQHSAPFSLDREPRHGGFTSKCCLGHGVPASQFSIMRCAHAGPHLSHFPTGQSQKPNLEVGRVTCHHYKTWADIPQL